MTPTTAATIVTDFASLDPSPEIADQVLRYKAEVRRLVGDQIYLNEPPHMTAYLARFSGEAPVSMRFSELAEQIAPFTIELAGFFAFDADPLTGARTLVIQFSEATNAKLRQIQNQIAKMLGPLRDPGQTAARYQQAIPKFSEVQRSALTEFGFPFVGDDWHPHFTIASIRSEDWPAVEKRLLADSPRGEMICSSLSHYRVDGNESRKLQSYLLDSQAQR